MSTAVIKGNVLCYKGSNFMRQRLILSILSGKPVRITHIRILEDEPGLKKYEVSFIKLLDRITNGTIIEFNETGTALYFQPGLLYGGNLEYDCNIHRAIGYYLEPLVMLGLFCKEPLNVTLHGVTNNDIDPSLDLLKYSMLNVLKKFVLDAEGLDLKVVRRGMLPLGGGQVIFKCPVRQQLRPVQLTDSGMVKRIRGIAYALRVSPTMANRMIDSAKGVCLKYIPDVYINSDQCKGKQAGKSPGFGIHLTAETTTGVVYAAEQVSKVSENGQDPSVPEDIGTACAQRLLFEIYSGGLTDSTCQSLAVLFMALGPQDVSKILLGPLTDYTVSFLRHLKEFFGVTFKLENYEPEDEQTGSGSEKIMLTCVGIGFKNISKRTV